MLSRIEIHQIALIDEAVVEFTPGLNVLTGETGAGKSILIDALNLVLGVRADRDLIAANSQKAVVEASFLDTQGMCDDLLVQFGIEREQTLTLSRELYANGRNVCRINGTLVNNATLQQISARLIDIHGQHEHQSLFNPQIHIELLDAFGGKDVLDLRERMRRDLAGLRSCVRELGEFGANDGERERRLDILRYQKDEIERANLKPGEDEDLGRQRLLLNNAQRIAEVFARVHGRLFGDEGGIMDNLRAVVFEMSSVSPLDPSYETLANGFDETFFSLEAAADAFERVHEGLDFDPMLSESIGKRLDEIQTLKRKYGGSIEAILKTAEDVDAEIDRLVGAEDRIKALEAQKSLMTSGLYDTCMALHDLRVKAAQRFESLVTDELLDLGMGRVRFAVSFSPIAEKASANLQSFSANGLDRVEFLLSANPGQPLRPLSRIASGGEAARIMLALKNISAQLDGIDCLIFDEIDSGISGQMAHIVAQKMAAISRGRQVLCVTHLAQLASMADMHYLIEKQADLSSTRTKVIGLLENSHAIEVARLLGGEGEGGHGLAHAKEMIARANGYKQSLSKR
jgi:DNA repair protein RecN (Recombination protein N)